jgi:transposase-like protein
MLPNYVDRLCRQQPLVRNRYGNWGLPRAKTPAVELPPRDTKRWTARRKAAVVEAVHSGMITIEEVCRRYALSVEEFLSWHNTIQRHGVQGLQITKLRNYRYAPPKRG